MRAWKLLSGISVALATLFTAPMSTQAQSFEPTVCGDATSHLVVDTAHHAVDDVVTINRCGAAGGVEFLHFPNHFSTFAVDVAANRSEINCEVIFCGTVFCPHSGHGVFFIDGCDDNVERTSAKNKHGLRFIFHIPPGLQECQILHAFLGFAGPGARATLGNFAFDDHPADHPVFTHTNDDLCVCGIDVRCSPP